MNSDPTQTFWAPNTLESPQALHQSQPTAMLVSPYYTVAAWIPKAPDPTAIYVLCFAAQSLFLYCALMELYTDCKKIRRMFREVGPWGAMSWKRRLYVTMRILVLLWECRRVYRVLSGAAPLGFCDRN